MLCKILENHLKAKNIKACLEAVTDNRLNGSLITSCSDEIQLVLQFLTEDNFKEEFDFFLGCETLLKEICNNSNEDEVMFELLEVIETTASDNIFTSALKGLQISILKQKTSKSRALAYVLDSIYSYVSKLPFPENLIEFCEDEEAKLIESNDEVNRILMMYITLFFFLEPIHKAIITEKSQNIFKDCTVKTKKNVLLSFLFKISGPPFAYLEIKNTSEDDKKISMSYSLQCGESLVTYIASLLGDPHFLLPYIEKRFQKSAKHNEKNEKNIYKMENQIPTLSIAIYYYLILSQKLLPQYTPKIYSKLYIFETCLNLSTILMKQNEGSLIHKGIVLAESLIKQLNGRVVNFREFPSAIIKGFITQLLQVIQYSTVPRNRNNGVTLLKEFIYTFDSVGRFNNIKFILSDKNWKNIHGYVSIIYKNLVDDNLLQSNMSIEYIGNNFKEMLLNFICNLPDGTTTDLMDYADKILSALNVLRYFCIRDKSNKTGFMDIKCNILDNFLKPLRKALDISKAHYKVEEINLINKSNDTNAASNSELLGLSNLNGTNLPQMTNEDKLKALVSAFNTFDVMESLLARVNECIS